MKLKMNTENYNSASLVLIIKSDIKFGINTIYIVLYDFVDDEPIAYIDMNNLGDGINFEIQRSYAKPKWGHIIYDYALMTVYPNALIPSKIINPKALNIWKYYYDLREDVTKIDMNTNDKSLFSVEYINELGGVKTDEHIKYINCYYFLDKSTKYLELVKIKEKINIYNIIPSLIIKNIENKFLKNLTN